MFFLLFSASSLPYGAPTADSCYVFYSHNPAEQGPLCPLNCPVHTHCKGDTSRTSCTAVSDCKYLLPRGKEVEFTWSRANGTLTTPYQACVSCLIKGCSECGGSDNGQTICKKCAVHWKSDGQGGCEWNAYFFDYAVYSFIALVGVLLVWIVSSLIRAECAEIKNLDALKRGLVMRRRAQLFMSRSVTLSEMSSSDSSELDRYPLTASIHSVASGRMMGPGLTLFMNWFIYVGCLSAFLGMGALIYGLREADLSPCVQQDRISTFVQRINTWIGSSGVTYSKLLDDSNFGEDPLVDDRDNGALKWAIWNYTTAFITTYSFLYYQQRLWNCMIQDDAHPSLREYTVMLSGLPRDLIDKEYKQKIHKSLGDWMTRLHLDSNGIKSISIAYDIPGGKTAVVEDAVERLLNSVAASKTVSSMTSTTVLDDSGSNSSVWFFWVQLLGLILFQTPFRAGARHAKVSPELQSEQVKDVLLGLRGSGKVFVVMNTEALARAVVGMGQIKNGLRGISDKPVRVCKAPAEPQMICWNNYGMIPWYWRIFRTAGVFVVLFFALFIWLLLFASFLSFELATNGYKGVSKEVAGIFVGMLVPIGNALMGLVVDLLMKNYGFRDEDDLQLWRHMLNVAVNTLANVGEVYLVFKKTLLKAEWQPDQFFLNFSQVFKPIGVHPSAFAFQEELKAILFPMGMLVPIFTIPLLGDVVPFLIGRLRIKGDPCIRSVDAERILRPADVDHLGPYTDFIINLSFLCFASWICPGKYLVTLWITMCIWLFLLYLNMRMNVLRWHSVNYFGGKKAHHCEALLLAIPLGYLAAALNHRLVPAHYQGILGFCLQFAFHLVFVQYVLHTLEPPRASFGTTVDEMMTHEHAPLANYENTNPVEVLRRHYTPELEPDRTPLIFFRNDKWYLQPTHHHSSRWHFHGEEKVGQWSLRRNSKDHGKQSAPTRIEGRDPELAITNPFDSKPESTNPFSPPPTPGKFDPIAGESALRSRLEQLKRSNP